MKSNREMLLETAQRGELHHALILHGPSPDLLRKIAFDIARTLNCLNHSLGDDCISCSKIDREIHPDVHHTAVASEKKLISVEQIRDLVSAATLRPYEGRVKVFIVEDADAMSAGGANALLKTLEEPSRDTVFLLLTRSADLLLPTVRSRSQSIPLRPEVVVVPRKKGSKEPAQLDELAVLFPQIERGLLEEAVNAIVDALEEFATVRNGAALLRLAAELSDWDDPSQALAVFGYVLRDLAVAKGSGDERRERIREALGPATLLRAADRAVKGGLRLSVNTDARLLLEQCVIELART